jgi:hypothetical protein
MYEEKLRQKEAEAGQSGRAKELEEQLIQLKTKMEYQQEQMKYTQEQSDRKFQEGVKSQEGYISELKARIQALEAELVKARDVATQSLVAQKLEELAKKDDHVADKLSKLFNRTIDGLSRKIASLKPGGVDEEIEYKPNEFVLENLLKQELESNLGTVTSKEVAAKEKTSENVDDRLAKLKSIREGFGKPREEDKK